MRSKTGLKGKQDARKADSPSRVLIITGLSGSGKTVALRAVEDMNFYCVDNLPVSLISSLASKVSGPPSGRNTAIGIDIREKEFLGGIERTIRGLRARHAVEIIFLDAETDVLIRRFKETRRPHPLGGDLEEAIRTERERLSEIRRYADRIIDTSTLSPHQLRGLVSSFYQPVENKKKIAVSLISFGFKYGAPQNIDLLFDVRFLPNPFFVPELKNMTGLEKKVADYVFKHPETGEFMKKTTGLLRFLLPLYIREGKSYLSVAFGCTGGNHRSPAIVEKIAADLDGPGVGINVIHREIP